MRSHSRSSASRARPYLPPRVRAMERTPHGWRGFSVGPEGKPTLMQPVLVLATLAREQLALVRQRRVVCAHPVTKQARSRNLTFGNFRTGNVRKLPSRKLPETSDPETAEPTRRGRVLSSHFAEATRPPGQRSARSAPAAAAAAWAVALRCAAQRSAVEGGQSPAAELGRPVGVGDRGFRISTAQVRLAPQHLTHAFVLAGEHTASIGLVTDGDLWRPALSLPSLVRGRCVRRSTPCAGEWAIGTLGLLS
jgi:hypothetical protein